MEREKPRSDPFIKILQCRAERQGSENASYKVILSQRHLGYNKRQTGSGAAVALAHPPGQLSLGCSALPSPPVVQLPSFLPEALTLQSSCLGVRGGGVRRGGPHASPGLFMSPQEPFGLQPGLLGPPLPAGVLGSRLEAVQGEGHALGHVPRTPPHPPTPWGRREGSRSGWRRS